MPKVPTQIKLANPRGFCAGVDRAIDIVNRALDVFGPPIYVRHEVVHNRFVVDSLRERGAIFVEELDEVPDDVIVIFSAHGVSRAVQVEAERRGLKIFDATCPLVTKVHMEVLRYAKRGQECILIGHAGHPEVIGTFGQVPEGAMSLIETVEDAEAFTPPDPANLAFLTQTTLSVDDTAAVVATLQRRFPLMQAPRGEDICYATSNRQAAVKAIAGQCDAMLVIGAPNSSNSVRLVEVAEREGIPARLIQRAADLDWSFLHGVGTLGITAGASAPEQLVRELVDLLATRYDVTEREEETTRETIAFKLPRGLEAA